MTEQSNAPQKIAIADASVEQLRNFAEVGLQIEVPKTANSAVITSRLREAGFSGDDIPLIKVQSPTSGKTSFGNSVFKDPETGRQMCRINIPTQEKPGGQEPVPAGVNGVVMLLPRGQDINVPVEYVEVLKNAVSYHYKPYTGFNADGSMSLGGLDNPDKVEEFPFSQVAV